MKKIALIAAIGFGLSIAACSKLQESPNVVQKSNKNSGDIQPVSQKSIADYFAANPGSSETLKGDASKAINLPTKSGALIMIYPGSLVDLDGNDITGEVTFHLQEFYTAEDMIKANVQTLTDKGELLYSGGMFKLEVTQNGKTLRIKDGYRYGVQFSNTENGMAPYMGVKDPDGSTKWAQRNDWLLQRDSSRGNNVIYLDSFTYCNLDGLGNFPDRTEMKALADPSQVSLDMHVHLIFTAKRICSYLPGTSTPGEFYTGSHYDVPKGQEVKMVVYGIDDEGYLYWYDTVHTIGDNEEIQLPKLEKISESDWKARMAALK
ncbi:MAG: hypothetical protein GC180_00805 [Bacteroidetes bacterium]|nr:hypothetical protein [Bacteroidota bacterium]